MPLRGNLENLRLGDVLQTVLGTGGHGVLRVRSGGRRAVLHVGEKGLRYLDPEVLDDRMIVEAFVHRGAVAPEIVERARRLAGTSPSSSMLEPLLMGGSLDRAALQALLADAAEDALLDVLSWTQGDFVFEEGDDTPRGVGRVAEVAIDANTLLLRAAQRIDEQAAVAEAIGAHAVLLLPAGEGGRLEGCAPAVLARTDGERMLDEIALETGTSFFEVKKAAAALVAAGAARLPSATDLVERAQTREKAGDARGAAALLRQWQGQTPDDVAAHEAAAALAARRNRPDDEAEALRALGHAQQRARKPGDARKTFERLVAKRPGDRDALDDLRRAARDDGDVDEFVRATKALAGDALAAGDAATAAAQLKEILDVKPRDVEARVLRTKALVRAGENAEAIAEIEAVSKALPVPLVRRTDRDHATYCRETLAHLAPDRGDLVRRFRAMLEGRQRSRRRVAIVVAALVLAGGVAFVVRPKSAASVLREARDAADRGDMPAALAILSTLEEEHADAPEAAEAAGLRARWAPAKRGPAPEETLAVASVQAAAEKARDAFAKWPDSDAVAQAEALAATLRTATADVGAARRQATDVVWSAFGDAVATLRRDALTRRDALEVAAVMAKRPPATAEAVGEARDRAKIALDPTWAARARAASATARRLLSVLTEAAIPRTLGDDVRGLEGDVDAAARAVAARAEDVVALSREHHRLVVVDAYEHARTDGARLLARGDIAGARALQRALDELLAAAESDASLRTLVPGFERRGIVEFAVARATLSRAIDEGIAAGREAERTGNLAGAAAQYARLVRQFPQVRFDEAFTIPLRVVVVPADANVSLNGRPVAQGAASGVVVRYGWGSAATLSVAAEGYEAASVVLDTASDRPDAELRVRLLPKRRWTQALPGSVEAPLLGIPGGVVVCSRSGRVERRSIEDGSVAWAVETRCVEGVRGRPALSGEHVWVPLLDGRVARIVATSGAMLPPLQLRDRPVGDAAAVADRVAFAMDGSLAVFDESGKASHVPLPAAVTAGVHGAHGAFWVGDVSGGVTRVDARTLAVRTTRPGTHGSVIGFASDSSRVYALADDGTLYALGAGGVPDVLWSRPGLGDVTGRPAHAGGTVAVADRAGRIHLFSAADGATKGTRETRSSTRDGVTSAGGRIVASLADGRVWAFDPAKDAVVVDAPLEGTARLAPAEVQGGVAVPAAGNGISVLPLGP